MNPHPPPPIFSPAAFPADAAVQFHNNTPPPPLSAAVQFYNHSPHLPPAAAAANATPSVVATSINHPPYSEMIYAAITALKEQDGSSKRAIAKYIERVYPDLPATHSALLTQHLKRLKNSGLLVMVKKSYKLPRSDIDDNLPLPTVPLHPVPPPAVADIPSTEMGPKPSGSRPRGRPRNKSSVQPVLVALGLVEEPAAAATATARRPGRPRKSGPKSPVPVGNGFGGEVANKRGPGRPPKSGPGAVVGSYGLKRRPGRPPKAQPKPVLIPHNVNGTHVPRPRGRPKKGTTLAGVGVGGGGGGVLGKRRGRPPKVSGGVVKPMKRTGRSVGRPKKNASWDVTGGARDQQLVECGNLKRKLEYFQSKVKQAVGVLKPQLTNESALDAVAAVQVLEGLAVMDISAPLIDEAQEPLLQS